MDAFDQYYQVLKKSGLDGPVACEVIDLTKKGKLMVGELNQNAIESLKDLPSSKAIEVLTAFSKKQVNSQTDNNQRICDMIRNKKEPEQTRPRTSRHKRPNQDDDQGRPQPVYSTQQSQSKTDVTAQGLLPTPSQNRMYGPHPYPPPLQNMQPWGQGVIQQIGPSNYHPRGPNVNKPRGPSVNRPRGPGVNQPMRFNVNNPRGQNVNQQRGPCVNQTRGPCVNPPRGPCMNQPFSCDLPLPDQAILGKLVPPNMYHGNMSPNYNQQPIGNLNIISDLPISGNTEKEKRGRNENVKSGVDGRENTLDKNLNRLLNMSNDPHRNQEEDKKTNNRRRGKRGGRGKSRNNETNVNSGEESDNDDWKGSIDRLNKDSHPMLGNKFFSETNLADNRGRDRTSNRRGRGRSGRGCVNQTVDVSSTKRQDRQGCRGQHQGRTRNRGMSGRKYDDNTNSDNSDGQSDSGSCYGSFGGSQQNLDRSEKRKRDRGGRARGRGTGGTASRQRTETSSTISDSDTDKDDEDAIDENEVFKFVVKECKGLISLSEFTEKCHLFPDGCDIAKWFRRHRRRFRLIVNNHELAYIAPLYMDATICLDHNRLFSNSRGCRKNNCEHFHICKNFVAGFCRFRNNCRYGHSFGSKTNREKKQRLGLDEIFTNADVRTILQNRYPMLCPDYFGKKHCEKENACPFLHLCKKFISGKCAEGSNCKYSHEMKTGHNMWILGLYGWAAAVRKNEDFVKKVILIGRSRKSTNERVEHKDGHEEEDDEGKVDDENVDDENEEDDMSVDDESEEGDDDNMDDGNVMDTFKELEENLPANPVSRKDRFKDAEDIEPKELEDIAKLIKLQQNFDELQLQMEELKKSKETSGGTKPKTPKEAWNITPDKPVPMPRKASKPPVTLQQSWTKDDAATISICAGYVGGTCQGCDNGHHPTEALPYLWQIKMKTWICLDSMRNQEVEEEFCRNSEVIDTEILIDGTSYLVHICYDEQKSLKAVVYVCDGVMVDNSYSLPARRLSTESYCNRSDKGFYTQWRWYWKDDNCSWILYDKDIFQKTLESKYLFGQPSFLFTRSTYQFKYRIDFRTLKQVNLDTRKQREIMRRPLYISSSDVTNKKFPSLSVSPIPAAPANFAPWDMTSDFELVEVDHGKSEFKDVKSHFQTTMKSDRFRITFIYRVQNRKLLSEYEMKKKNMMDDIKQDGDNRDIGEKDLFHGTDTLDTCRAICTNNFDFRTSGKNATMYGEGSYFAVDAKYSHSYTKQGHDGQRYIFRAKILAGLSTKGQSSYRRPPLRPNQAHKLFDSCVDTEDKPNIYVIFDRGQCYPEYLIAYREEYNYAVPHVSSHQRQVEANYPTNVAQQEVPSSMVSERREPEIVQSIANYAVKKVVEKVAAPLRQEQLRSYMKEGIPVKEKRHQSDKECVVQ